MGFKMGIVGLSKVIAMDTERYNVRSNCIAPFAWSRLIGTIPTAKDALYAEAVDWAILEQHHVIVLAALPDSWRVDRLQGSKSLLAFLP